ncbi:MAG: FxLYD domain-containing protein [Candidatus Methylomirabilota bacterium]|jgi:hypothetical protein
MPLVILAVVGVLLTIWPSPAAPAELSCQALPPGSLSQIECEYIQAKLTKQREHGNGASQLPAGSAEAVTHFVCPDEKAVEIGSLEGSLGGEIQGTYRNGGQEAVSEVIVGFALFDARNQFVTTIEAAVLPRTIPPGGTGTFAAVVPAPSALGWTCFRYEITGLPD